MSRMWMFLSLLSFLVVDARQMEEWPYTNANQRIQLAWCNIHETNPVRLSCQMAIVPDWAEDDTTQWIGKSYWFDSTCTFSDAMDTMSCFLYSSKSRHNYQATCYVQTLQDGYAPADACTCDQASAGYYDEACVQEICTDGEEECDSPCWVDRSCQKCTFPTSNVYSSNRDSSTVDYNGIPWFDGLVEMTQEVVGNGTDTFYLESYLNVSQASVQNRDMMLNMEFSQCTDRPVSSLADSRQNEVLSERLWASKNGVFWAFPVLLVSICAAGVLFFVHGRRRRRGSSDDDKSTNLVPANAEMI